MDSGRIEAANSEANSRPKANRYDAYFPAMGASARAACSAEVICVAPTSGLLKNAAAQQIIIADSGHEQEHGCRWPCRPSRSVRSLTSSPLSTTEACW